ncbi:hypothetical protein B5E58_07270 [Tyzzerella sp. An114]|mgnify:CR=1 FL=1|uniref:SHOCT-like domain-containing protein n=1 Tax=Tyzzerella sp. An114 TaxID=1965545 RepID=UPI000B43618F|nr:hypothetical protein [Tyzzerella sp. An114]OUQ58414.1 hypothetical protein B5E58_07270 [Tyzzerella sp. An114]
MNEERMAVLRMLEKGVINADEAERLIVALSQPSRNSDALSHLGDVINKAGDVLSSVAKNVGDKAKEAEPVIKKTVNDIADKAIDLKHDLKTYAEKRKKAKEAVDDLEDIEDIDDSDDFECNDEENQSENSDENSNDDSDEDIEKSVDFTQEAYLNTIADMLKAAEENSDFLDMMQSACGGDDCDSCDSCGNCKGTSFEQRVVCNRTEPCCGENGYECKNEEPCCNDENICFKEVHCCGLKEDCGKLSPCCWDDEGKEYAKKIAKENGTEVGDFIVKNPRNDENVF